MIEKIYFRLLWLCFSISYFNKIAISFYLRYGANRRNNNKNSEKSIIVLYEPRLERIVKALEKRMRAHAKELEFEQATLIRNKILELKQKFLQL